MITEDYVSFEIAKLLKEKGFNGLCTAYYDCFTTDNFHCGYEPTDFNSIDTKIRNIISAPTLQMAMRWLRKEHNLYIDNLLLELEDGDYGYIIHDIVTRKYLATSRNHSYQSPEEAAEAAIKYCLDNLI